MKSVKINDIEYKITVTPWASMRITAYQRTMGKYSQTDNLQERAKRFAEAVRDANDIEQASKISLDIISMPQVEPTFSQEDADREIKEKCKAVLEVSMKPMPAEEDWDAAIAEVLIYSNENWGRVLKSSDPFFQGKPNR